MWLIYALSILVMNVLLELNLKLVIHDRSGLENHRILLIKSIVMKFVGIRINHICKNTVSYNSVRNFYTKLVLFKGQ